MGYYVEDVEHSRGDVLLDDGRYQLTDLQQSTMSLNAPSVHTVPVGASYLSVQQAPMVATPAPHIDSGYSRSPARDPAYSPRLYETDLMPHGEVHFHKERVGKLHVKTDVMRTKLRHMKGKLENVLDDDEREQLKQELASMSQPLLDGDVSDSDLSDAEVNAAGIIVNPWSRLICLSIGCAICAGLAPGISLYGNLFAESGVFSTVCNGKLLPGRKYCDASRDMIQGVLQFSRFVTFFGAIPAGLLYDRFGSRWINATGGSFVLLGYLLLLIPVFGAEKGNDAATCMMFPFIYVMIDFWAMTNTFSVLGLLWHFPYNFYTVVTVCAATYRMAAFQPVLVRGLMAALDAPLGVALFIYTLFVALGLFLCYENAPEHKETLAQAQIMMQIPLPKPPTQIDLEVARKAVLAIKAVVKQHQIDFLLWSSYAIGAFSFVMLYRGSVYDFGKDAFGSHSQAQLLSTTFLCLNGALGVSLVPVGLLWDELDTRGLKFLVMIQGAGMFIATLAVGSVSWPAQTIAQSFMSGVDTLALATLISFAVKYSSANRLGTMVACMMLTAALGCFAVYLTWSTVLAYYSDNRVESYRVTFEVAGIFSCVAMGPWIIRLMNAKPPESPTMGPSDELDICKPFGCRNFEELMYVSFARSKAAVFKPLASMDPQVVRQFILSLDQRRLQEVTHSNGLSMPDLREPIVRHGLDASAHIQRPSDSLRRTAIDNHERPRSPRMMRDRSGSPVTSPRGRPISPRERAHQEIYHQSSPRDRAHPELHSYEARFASNQSV